jgi:hypothetical protein
VSPFLQATLPKTSMSCSIIEAERLAPSTPADRLRDQARLWKDFLVGLNLHDRR